MQRAYVECNNMYKCPKHGFLDSEWCDECESIISCDCSKLETSKVKDVCIRLSSGELHCYTIYITHCVTCGKLEKTEGEIL